ncbi:hypothetical protein X798_04220 [Onchocerca flexuosa]|uniref:Ovule protein n=2 Tax=Onchocerca flexuosa TaxID=387005 RepID=A0A183HJ51_9BILA|nr:hypothetical protein X798_04220 [Onchocerca flexuosa]VDO51330.1 unnamed protein product [Onchocerca flexuosa]
MDSAGQSFDLMIMDSWRLGVRGQLSSQERVVVSSFALSFPSNFPDNLSMASSLVTAENPPPPPFPFPYYSTNQMNSTNGHSNNNSTFTCTAPQMSCQQPSLPFNSNICRKNVFSKS